MKRNYIAKILAFSGIVAPLTMAVITFIAGLTTPGYNHLTDTISTLSGQDSASPDLMIAGFVCYGILITSFAFGLYLRLQKGIRSRVLWLALTLHGIGMILAGVFRDSPVVGFENINAEGIMQMYLR